MAEGAIGTTVANVDYGRRSPLLNEAPASSRLVTLFEAAKTALAEALCVDDLMEVNSRLSAIQEYARQASDRTLEINAAELRIRAKRRLGEELCTLKRNGEMIVINHPKERADELRKEWGRDYYERKRRGLPRRVYKRLKEMGISNMLSSEAQRHALLSTEKFEMNLAAWRERAFGGTGRVGAKLPAVTLPRQPNMPSAEGRDRAIKELNFRSLSNCGGKKISNRTLTDLHAYRSQALQQLRDALFDLDVLEGLLSYQIRMSAGQTIGEVIGEAAIKQIMAGADERLPSRFSSLAGFGL